MPTITIDWSWFNPYLAMSPLELAWFLFSHGGFLILIWIAWQVGKSMWLTSRQTKYYAGLTFTTLSVNVPRLNEQSPQAIEHMFAHLAGTHSTPNFKEKWLVGKVAAPFSFEFACIDGNTRFVIRTLTSFRDLVEAAVFSQYPDAEITQFADYVDGVPGRFPNPEWECWGTEFTLAKEDAYPLRSWQEFEHQASGEFKDPLATLLESLSRLKKGEQVWLQILLWTTDSGWAKEGAALVKRLSGKEAKSTKSLVIRIAEEIGDVAIRIVRDLTTWGTPPESEGPKKDDKPANLSSGERKVIEAIENKITKTGFECKMRMIYVGKRDVFRKGPVISMIKGALGLFGSIDANSLKGYGKVSPKTDYFWQRWSAESKKNAIMSAYRERSGFGAPPFILNIEELASIWHFPQVFTKAPQIRKVESKKVEPPFELPMSDV